MSSHPEIDRIFRCQHGVAAVGQLCDAGISRRTVSRWVASEAVVPLLPGVVRLAATPETFPTRAMAVQLHTAPEGFLIGPTAAHIRRLRSMPTDRIHVVHGLRGRSKLPSWVRRHGTSWRDESDVEVVDGFRVERPLPMMLSLASLFNQFRFECAAEDAWHLGLVTPQSADAYLEAVRRQGRHGVTVMDTWLAKTAARDRPAQSNFEMEVLRAVRRAGLPEPVLQHPVTLRSGETIHVDLAWPDVRFGVEPGHSWWHGGDLAQRRDQARARAAGAVGWELVFYDEDARRDLAAVGGEIRDLYTARRHLLGRT